MQNATISDMEIWIAPVKLIDRDNKLNNLYVKLFPFGATRVKVGMSLR